MKLQYEIYDTKTQTFIKDPHCIVTQDGNVAWWDEGQGWLEDEEQYRYDIRIKIM